MTGDDFDTVMCRAAKNRQMVELVDGRRGVLVYWPGRSGTSSTMRPPRHGDRTMAGVRLEGSHPDHIAAVRPHDVIGFVVEVSA